MAISYKNLPNVRFPAYVLPNNNWQYIDGVLFLEAKILDDTNMPGTSLGLRRLQTPHKKELYRLRKLVPSIAGILKNGKYFIDSNGVPFEYGKSRYMALKYYKIEKVVPKGTASLLYVKGISTPFNIPRPPKDGCFWAGILHLYGLPWMLYGYSPTKLEDSRRKV